MPSSTRPRDVSDVLTSAIIVWASNDLPRTSAKSPNRGASSRYTLRARDRWRDRTPAAMRGRSHKKMAEKRIATRPLKAVLVDWPTSRVSSVAPLVTYPRMES